jgi:hypothetical protein
LAGEYKRTSYLWHRSDERLCPSMHYIKYFCSKKSHVQGV